MTRTFVRATVIALAVAIVAGPFAAARSAASSCASVTTQGEWSKIAAPAFPSGPAAISAYAIDPQAPTMIFATNGVSVMRSMNGGCSWDEMFALDLLPSLDKQVSSANTTIKHIAIPEAYDNPRSVFLTLEERVGPAIRPHVAASYDAGRTWTIHNEGLPLASGGIYSLAIAPSESDFIYLLLKESPATQGDAVYASQDAGASWERRSQSGSGLAIDLAVDPLSAEELWLWGAELYHSLDGGRTRTTIEYVAPPVPIADVFHAPGQPSRVFAYEAETQSFNISRDGGKTWARIVGPPIFSHSMAHSRAGDILVSGHNGVYGFVPPEFWVEIHPEGQPDLYDLQVNRSGDSVAFGLAPETNTIWRYNALGDKLELDPFTDVDVDAVGEEATQLSPQRKKVKIEPGKSKTVRYNLGLPAHPTPLDVFFLVDTSQSMESTINGLRAGMQEVINDLERERIDVHFGVGEYKDYPIPGYGNPEMGDFPYRLDRTIGPADAGLANALERLEATGGGSYDKPESQLTGLYQAATGAGDPGFVAEGQDASFRPTALKVIVHLTDAPFHTEASHPSPAWDIVVDALTDKGILQIGLAVYGPYGPTGLGHLTDMAEATGTRAPAGGVDCDGDGHDDVAGGQALACTVANEQSEGTLNLAPAIISTLKAVTHDVRVELRAEDSPRLAGIDPALYPTFNVNERKGLTFDVEFTCPKTLADTREEISLAALVAGRAQASASALVVCKPLDPFKPDKENVLPTLLALIPARGIPAPPPVPPGPVETAPTQQMFQAQPVAAAQEQEEVQTAMAWQTALRNELAKAEEYSFSTYRPKPQPPWPLYSSAVVMAMAYAAATALRARAALHFARR